MGKKTIIIITALLLTASAAFCITIPQQWHDTEVAIRDSDIDIPTAKDRIKNLRPLLDKYFTDNGGIIAPYTGKFPVEGYSVDDAALKGYEPRGYNFYDMNKHSDHPALDIFIRDNNKDCYDDKTINPVRILSVGPGIVVSMFTSWQPTSKYKGGNYVWIYDPVTKGLFYYAHMDFVFVKVGQMIKRGDPIGTVGRTGKNAYAKRSPTHLHIMYLTYPDNGNPRPKNVMTIIRPQAVEAKVVQKTGNN